MIRSALGWKTVCTCAPAQRTERILRWTLAPVLAAGALAWPGIGQAQTARLPATSVPDVCEIGDMERMSASSAHTINYAGIWILDLSRSERLPALWMNAESATMVVTQDAEQLTPALTVVAPGDTMPYTVISYRLDGSLEYSRGGTRQHVRIAADLRYADGGRALVLRSTQLAVLKDADLPEAVRSTDPAQANDIELLHETTQRWELAEGGRALRVCRILKGPLTRTGSKLIFIRK